MYSSHSYLTPYIEVYPLIWSEYFVLDGISQKRENSNFSATTSISKVGVVANAPNAPSLSDFELDRRKAAELGSFKICAARPEIIPSDNVSP